MALDVKLPSVGESVTSGTIGAWTKKSGDFVRTGDPIAEIETDKVTFEIFAERAGVLKALFNPGDTVEVGQVIARIEDAPEPEAASSQVPAPASAPAPAAPALSQAHADPAPAPSPPSEPDATEPGPAHEPPDLSRLSPAVRALIEEHEIDAAQIRGSGKEGRILKSDILTFIEQKGAQPAGASPAVAPERRTDGRAEDPSVRPGSNGGSRTTRKPMSQLRRKIAQRLVNAQQDAALLTTFNEADLSNIMALRKTFQDRFSAKHGIKLGFMSFFVQAVVQALKSVPALNAQIDGDAIIQNHFFDIGVAISTEKGLLVPVLRDCDGLSLADIERAITEFAGKARAGKITLPDLEGGCFTITNGGIFGSLLSTPILNPPQSGILGMHAIQERPVAVQGRVEIRPMMYLALTYDHRLVDGKEAVTFLVRVKEFVENPALALLDC